MGYSGSEAIPVDSGFAMGDRKEGRLQPEWLEAIDTKSLLLPISLCLFALEKESSEKNYSLYMEGTEKPTAIAEQMT